MEPLRMRSKSRRATIIWLIMIALLLGVVLVSGALAPQAQLLLVAGYAILALIAGGFFTSQEVRSRLPKMPSRQQTPVRRAVRKVEASAAARRAQERAKGLTGYRESMQLVDVGLIASEVGADGLRLRRERFTLDDEGLQPYIVVHVDSSWANERVSVRFEILDHAGEVQFVREEEVLLREGNNNLLCNYRLPLDDRSEGRPGLWELRASVDSSVIGLHTFGVGPSLRERQRLIEEESEAVQRRQRRLRETLVMEEDDSPVSLEELLRGRQ
jgi:hypothetical protein